MIRPTAVAAALAVTALTAAGQADATVRGENPQTRKRLAEIEQKLRGGKVAEAADDLDKILSDAGDDLVTADGKSYLPARRYVHRFIGQLPPAELKLYQDRTDAPAKALLAAGDADSLRTLLDRYYCSRPGADALLRLGDLLFESGEVRSAETYWRQLTDEPYAGDSSHPNRPAKPAAILARLGLAAVYRSDSKSAAALLELLRTKYAGESGTLAGLTGVYADSLEAIIAAKPRRRHAEGEAGTWTALGGSPVRSGRTSGSFPPFLPMRPTWTTPLPRDAGAESGRGEPARPPHAGSARGLAFHPVVVGDTVYVADALRIMAFDLRTGIPKPGFDARTLDRMTAPPGVLRIPSRVDADYTISATRDTLYARFGLPSVLPLSEAARTPSVTAAVTLNGLRPKWQLFTPTAEGVPSGWEGASVPAGNSIVAAFARNDGGRIAHAVAAFTADGRRRLWTADVSDAPAGAPGRARHELVTVAGPSVVFCSHTGVISSIRTATGKPAWAYRYDKSRVSSVRPRDINPPVVDNGRVFVAPTDSDYVYAFDADTGRMLWRSNPVEVNQLVGVSAGKVVCTVHGPIAGVKAYSAETGSTDSPDGWVQHDDPGLATYGRGLLTDDFFLWPTAGGLFTLKLADGLPARQPNQGPHGNLAFAGGVLLVATPTELWGYVASPRPEVLPVPDLVLAPRPPFDLVAVGAGKPVPERSDQILPSLNFPLRAERLRDRPRPVSTPAFPPVALPRPVEISPIVSVPDGTIARVGEHHLVKYETTKNRVAWVLDGMCRHRFDPNAAWPGQSFLPFLTADGDRGVTFTTAGRGLLFNSADGTVRNNFPAAHAEHCGPAAFTNSVFVYPAGPGTVLARDRDSGEVRWRYPAKTGDERIASLSGKAPRVTVIGGDVFIAVRRTFGVELDRVDSDRGTPRWPKPVLLSAFDYDPTNLSVYADALVISLPDRVLALARDTGRPFWDTGALETPFCSAAAGNALLLVGRPMMQNDDDPVSATIRNPNPVFLAGRVRTLYERWTGRRVRVVAFDPATGRTLGDLSLAADGPDVAIAPTAAGLIVSAGTRTYRIH